MKASSGSTEEIKVVEIKAVNQVEKKGGKKKKEGMDAMMAKLLKETQTTKLPDVVLVKRKKKKKKQTMVDTMQPIMTRLRVKPPYEVLAEVMTRCHQLVHLDCSCKKLFVVFLLSCRF